MEREEAAVTCDGRLGHTLQTSGCNSKRSVADSGQTSMSNVEEETEFKTKYKYVMVIPTTTRTNVLWIGNRYNC